MSNSGSDLAGAVFLRSDALASGISDGQISRLVRGGEWHRIRHGAYVAGELWEQASPETRHALTARAVLLRCRTGAVLSHVSALPEYAAPTWGLDLGAVHLTRLDQRAGRKEAGVNQHRGLLLPDDVRTIGDVEVTAPARTVLDVIPLAGCEPGLVVTCFFLHAGLTTVRDLQASYVQTQSTPHTLGTTIVLRLADDRFESVGETRTFFLCRRQGLPAPEPQWVVFDAGGREFARLDFAWPQFGVWLEFDGKEKYLRYLRENETVVDAVLREKQREDRIRELTGWQCIRITWADLYHPERTAARIARKLGLSLPQ
jgi:hypothetical protein